MGPGLDNISDIIVFVMTCRQYETLVMRQRQRMTGDRNRIIKWILM